jgi:hypothetical protein
MSVAEISEAENLRLLRSVLDAEQRADAERQRADRLQAEREDLAYRYERLFGRDALYLSVFPHGPKAPPLPKFLAQVDANRDRQEAGTELRRPAQVVRRRPGKQDASVPLLDDPGAHGAL